MVILHPETQRGKGRISYLVQRNICHKLVVDFVTQTWDRGESNSMSWLTGKGRWSERKDERLGSAAAQLSRIETVAEGVHKILSLFLWHNCTFSCFSLFQMRFSLKEPRGSFQSHDSFMTFIIPANILVTQSVKNLPVVEETWVWFLGQEDPIEKDMATHSSVLAWKFPWTEEPGGLQSMGSEELGTT